MDQAPNSPALEQLLADSAWAWRLAARLTRDADSADDALQELWLRALRRPPELSGEPQAARPWIAVALRRMAETAARRSRARRERDNAAARAEAQPPAERALELEALRRTVVDAVLALPDAYRDVVLLHYFDGLSLAQIARRTNTPASTVRSQLARAQARLREHLGRRRDFDGRSPLTALAAAIPRSPTSAWGLSLVKLKLASAAAAVAVLALALHFSASKPATPASASVAAMPTVEMPSSTATPHESAALRADPQTARAESRPAVAADPARATIRVVRAGDFAPLEGAEVRWIEGDELRSEALLIELRDDQLEQRIAASDRSARSDAQGLAHVPAPNARRYVWARWNELWGCAWAHADMDATLEVVLAPDAPLEVEVLDAAGRPAEGVEVLIARAGRSQHELRAATVAANGIAHVPHALAKLCGGEPSGTLFVRAVTSHPQPPQVLVPAAPWPRHAIRLTLPVGGAVEVRTVDGEGKPLSTPASVMLSAFVDRRSAAPRRALSSNGAALFEHVPLNCTLSVHALPNDLTGRWGGGSTACAGPTRAGERVIVECPVVNSHPLITGRALDANGEPLARTLLHVDVRTAVDRAVDGAPQTCETDDEGRFAFSARIDPNERRPAAVLLRARELQLEAARNVTHPERGAAVELGDVRLAQPEVLASGRVVASNGAPIAGAMVQLHYPNQPAQSSFSAPLGYAGPDGAADELRVCTSDSSGRFELRAEVARGPIAIRANAEGYVWNDPVAIESGARDVELVLEPLTVIRGRVVGASGVVLERLRAHGANTSAQLDEHGRFALQSSGTAIDSVCIVGPESGDPLVCVSALSGPSDPRLERIALGDPPRLIELRLVDTKGLAVQRASVKWTGAGARRGELTDVTGCALIVSRSSEVDVTVTAPGMHEARFAGVRDADVLTLRPLPKLRLTVPEHLPAASRQRPYSVKAVSASGGAPRTVRIEAGREATLDLPSSGPWTVDWFVASGAAVLHSVALEVDDQRDEAVQLTLEVDAAKLERVWAELESRRAK